MGQNNLAVEYTFTQPSFECTLTTINLQQVEEEEEESQTEE